MGVRVIFWDSADQKLSLGSAVVDIVPSVGDTVGIFASGGAAQAKVKSRCWRADDSDDSPKPHMPYHVDLVVERPSN